MRNECPPVVPPFQKQKWGDEATRRLDMKVDASWTWAGGKALPGEEREGNFGHFFYTKRNECPPVVPPFQNQKWGDKVTRAGG